MSTIQHSAIPDANLHEPKGAASASADSFYVSDGAGSGSWKRRLYKYAASLTPSAVLATTAPAQSFTVTGVLVATDFIIGVQGPAPTAGVGMCGTRVTANDTVEIQFTNPTAGSKTPPSGTYTFIIWRT